MSRCSFVREVSDESIPEEVLDDVLANVARVGDPWGRSMLDDVWYTLDGGLSAVVLSALRAAAAEMLFPY
jgi:hypothetical protein